jgi:hypothetical protein
MIIFTPESTLREQLEEANAALSACFASQSYTIGKRTFTRADLPEIRNTINELERKLNATTGRSGPAIRATRRTPRGSWV